MQIIDFMKQEIKKKSMSQRKTGEVTPPESSKIHVAIKAALEKRERERILNLVEREACGRRLAF